MNGCGVIIPAKHIVIEQENRTYIRKITHWLLTCFHISTADAFTLLFALSRTLTIYKVIPFQDLLPC